MFILGNSSFTQVLTKSHRNCCLASRHTERCEWDNISKEYHQARWGCGLCHSDYHGMAWVESENAATVHHRLYPWMSPYVYSIKHEIDDGWYGGEDCTDPEEVVPGSRRVATANTDGSIVRYWYHPLPPIKSDCTHTMGGSCSDGLFTCMRHNKSRVDVPPKPWRNADAIKCSRILAANENWSGKCRKLLLSYSHCWPGAIWLPG